MRRSAGVGIRRLSQHRYRVVQGASQSPRSSLCLARAASTGSEKSLKPCSALVGKGPLEQILPLHVPSQLVGDHRRQADQRPDCKD